MKKYMHYSFLNILVMSMILTMLPGMAVASDVCGRGNAEPPFLSYGAKSNLLMLLDNSGSMLDMAYFDAATNCFDDNYVPLDLTTDPYTMYAGAFQAYTEDGSTPPVLMEAWYKWVDIQSLWEHTTYNVGDKVYANGIIYEALSVTGLASSGANIYEDEAVEWNPITRPVWKAGTVYHTNSFVYNTDDGYLYFTSGGGTAAGIDLNNETGILDWEAIETWEKGIVYSAGDYVQWKDVIYYTKDGGTANGSKPWDDTGVFWWEIDPFEWKVGTVYTAGDIVTYQGMIFIAQAGHTASGLTLYETNFNINWLRIDEGYYEEVTAAAAQTVCDTAAANADNTKYTSDGLCISLYDDSAGIKPTRTTAFAVSGNFLNWLTASKFDIQKSILTGGKFNADAERVVSENRGCSGSRFVKQVALDGGAGFLTLAVRGPRVDGDPFKKDRINGVDDTARIEVLAVSATGYDAADCQAAIDKILSHGLNGAQNEIDQCLAGTGTTADARTALNHAMQYCWQSNPSVKVIVDDCTKVYGGLDPDDIANWSNAYNCYGLFNANREHNVDRIGYVGRCWASATSATGSTCDLHLKDLAYCSPATCDYSFTDPGGTEHLLRNVKNKDITQRCTDWKVPGDWMQGCANASKWEDFSTDSLTHNYCDPEDAAYTGSTVAGWSRDIDGIPLFDAADTALLPIPLPDLLVPNNTGLEDEAAYCVHQAMEDYCSDLNVPEVIDPTDQETSTSGDYGNIPALLVDSGVLSRLGIDVPMNVMKGTALRSTSPIGILQKTSSDLRIGAMAFNGVGAYTECQVASTTSMIEKYCPSTNQDGAQLISRVKLGSQMTGVGRQHVDDLVDAVNAVRATSWTPVAEAVYNAIGYYTQNTAVRLNDGDFQTDGDVTGGWQNSHYYAPESYLMNGGDLYKTVAGGFSDGGSLLSDTGVLWDDVSLDPVAPYKGAWSDGALYNSNEIVSYDGKLYQTIDGGTATLKDEASLEGLSGPLYDAGVIWDFLIDPVINHCQGNYILIITEGASTADINADVERFARGDAGSFNTVPIDDAGEGAVDADVANQCTGGLLGSTYMDDLIYFARDENDEFAVYPAGNTTLPESDSPFDPKPKNNITTYVVTSGVVRDNGNADECNPAFLMDSAAANGGGTDTALRGENPQELEDSLLAVFNELRNRSSAGSAASVISSARGGEGAIYQAIFWPELAQGGTKVAWAGDVHGLFLDANGYMYEDTDGNRTLEPFPSEDLDGDGILDAGEDTNGNTILDGGDRRVIVFFDNTPGIEKSRVCWNTSILETLGVTCTDATDLDQVHFLWSANQWLSEYPNLPASTVPDDLTVETNRSIAGNDFHAANNRERYIFTWNDVDNDGIVGAGEVVDFVANADGGPDWSSGQLASDFDVADGIEVDKIIRWMRGRDLDDEDLDDDGVLDGGEDTNGNGQLDAAMRSRQSIVLDPDNIANTYAVTWRLGDIIHSTPMTVAAPAEGYHLIYDDFSYAQFLARWKNRRHMVYFGANDGMLHAVNAGFYRDTENRFYLDYDFSTSTYSDSGPVLGKEMWAYVPLNLHPHIKCLTDPNYVHKYFVDQRSRIFDVQIFEEEGACSGALGFKDEGCIHPNGWGTILVGGMRFGGSPILASELMNATAGDTRQFISSYFILDITNPEQPPELLGELTRTTDPATVDLGYTTVIPTMVIMKDKGLDSASTLDDTNQWYLILGSGPHDSNSSGADAMKGKSDQGAKVSVLPLDWLVGASKTALRIPAGPPTAASAGGTFLVPGAQIQSFTSDMITVDYDINPSYEEYKADAVYFGTVEGETDLHGNSGFSTYSDGATYWNGGGQMYRLVMEPLGHTVGLSSGDPVTEPDDWELRTMLNLGSQTDGAGNIVPQIPGHPIQPITAAASVGTDGYNFWIYFGTGRFFAPEDKTDRQQQSYYGLKEPMEMVDDGTSKKRKLNWEEVELSGAEGSLPGGKGLAKVDEILVTESEAIESAELACRDNLDIPDGGPLAGDYNCMPWTSDATYAYFDKMERYIAGNGRCVSNTCFDIPTCSGADYSDPNYKSNCVDGWRKDFWPYNNREKNVGQATLLGGLVTFTTYQPNSGVCEAEGSAYLYAVYYKTGTSWFENIFGDYGIGAGGVKNKLSLGRGLATTPNLHVGAGPGDDGRDGPKAFVQTSTGEIKEIEQDNLPVGAWGTGRSKWKEYIP